MQYSRITALLLFVLFFPTLALAGADVGQVPTQVELKAKSGGRLDGTGWSSTEMKGKVFVLFYVDPDEKDLNNEASEALRKEEFPAENYQSVAVINMAATWLPNFAIASSLKDKQKQYPRTLYVKDLSKELVKAWGLTDNTSDVLVVGKDGRVIFRKDGKLASQEVGTLIKTVKDNL